MVPYGEFCRNCLMEMYRCSIGALLEEAGGPRESEIPHGFREGSAELELLRTEAVPIRLPQRRGQPRKNMKIPAQAMI